MNALRRYFRYFDWISFSLILALSTIGLLFVFSSTYQDTHPYSLFFKKQVLGVASGLFIYGLFCTIDVRHLTRWGYYLYFVSVLLLVYTLFSGWMTMGAQRWLSLYFVRFQPSELLKLLLAPVLVAYASPHAHTKTNVLRFLPMLIILAISFLLILKQPDLGTGLIILLSGLIVSWYCGLPRNFFVLCMLTGLLGAPFLWSALKPYQQKRVMVLLGYGDTKKERYQIEQSTIAIGSGGITGKGFLKGTQNKLSFLPEDHTDFIFSVLCEEWGLLGALLTLTLFSLLIMRNLYIVLTVHTIAMQTLALGLLIPIMLSVIINICMVIGIMPIVGIPLPLISYGITNLWVTFASLGWLNNIAIRRFYY